MALWFSIFDFQFSIFDFRILPTQCARTVRRDVGYVVGGYPATEYYCVYRYSSVGEYVNYWPSNWSCVRSGVRTVRTCTDCTDMYGRTAQFGRPGLYEF